MRVPDRFFPGHEVSFEQFPINIWLILCLVSGRVQRAWW
jgi:hypothetical protein